MERHENLLGLDRWDWLAASALIALLVGWALLSPSLPLRVPTHFDLAGNPNGGTSRSALPWLIFGLPLGNWLLLWLLDLAMRGSDQEASLKAARPLRGLMTLGMSALSVALLLIPLKGPWVLWPALGFLTLCLGIGLWEAWLRRAPLPEGESEEMWKWGVFYVNPKDPRIWLPKRVGIGWTLNFGRPAGWFMLLLLLLPVLVVLLLPKLSALR